MDINWPGVSNNDAHFVENKMFDKQYKDLSGNIRIESTSIYENRCFDKSDKDVLSKN